MPRPSLRGAVSGSSVCTLALLLGLLLLAPRAAVAAPEIDRLDERLERLAPAIEALLAEHHVPGAAVAIVTPDGPLMIRGFGVRDLGTGAPVDERTVFAIGSSTKSMTGVLAATADVEAADGGHGPRLDDRVADLMPEFRFHDEDTGAAITMGDLMAHTSGVMRTDLMWYGGYASWEDIIEAFATAEPVADLGEEFHYQNVLYLVAGRILGERSRLGWDGLLQRRILTPLGMRDSGADVAMLMDPERAATGHERGELGKYAVREADGRPVLPWIDDADLFLVAGDDGYWRRRGPVDLSVIAPAGAVNSTAADMAAWLGCVLRRGTAADGTRVLPEAAFDAVWTPRIAIGPGVEYGLGFMMRDWRGRRLVEHGGNIDGFSSQVAWLPDDGVGLAVMANLNGTPAVQLATDVILGGLLEPLPDDDTDGGDTGDAAESPASLERFVGVYDASVLFGQPVEVLLRDGGLAIDVPGQMVYGLTSPDADGMRSFVGFPNIRVRFNEAPPAPRGDGDDDEEADATAPGPPPIQSIELHQGPLVFEWLKEGMAYPIEVPLEEFTPLVGRYRPEGSELAFRVLVRQNRLSIDVPGETIYALRPPDEDGSWQLRESAMLSVRFVRPEAAEGEAVDELADVRPATALILSSPNGDLELTRIAEDADDPLPNIRIVEFSVQASHGRDPWEQRLGIRLTGTVRLVNQGLSGPATLDLAGYDRLRDRLDLGLYGWMESGMFADRAWFDASFQPFSELPEEAASTLGQLHPALMMAEWNRVYDSVAVIGRRQDGDRRFVQVQGERAGQRPTIIEIDDRTWLVHRLETAILVPTLGLMPRTITFEDYREIDGYRLPMRITTEDPGVGRVERVYDAWELDPEVGQEIFRKHDPAG